MALNIKQKRFCEEYLIDLNATQAAIRAGYSAKTAYSQGQRLLKHAECAKYVAELMEERSEETKIDAAWVLVELHKQYQKANTAGDVKNSLGALGHVGKHVAVQAFNERSTMSVNLNDATDEELEARLAAVTAAEG